MVSPDGRGSIRLGMMPSRRISRFKRFTANTVIPSDLTQLSQLRTFSGFFALIFVVKPCVLIVAL